MKVVSIKNQIISLAAAGVLLVCLPALGAPLLGADNPPKAQPSPPANAEQKPEPPKKTLGPVADTIQPYRPAGRDPFKMTIIKPPSQTAKAKPPKMVGFPAFDVRRAEWRRLAAQNAAAGLAEPEATRQYLVNELVILGVFTDQRGPGAFVKAQPTGTTFFVRQGSKCYNGEILRIETDPSDLSGARVVFKEVSFLEVNGKQTQQERVVAKTAGAQGR